MFTVSWALARTPPPAPPAPDGSSQHFLPTDPPTPLPSCAAQATEPDLCPLRAPLCHACGQGREPSLPAHCHQVLLGTVSPNSTQQAGTQYQLAEQRHGWVFRALFPKVIIFILFQGTKPWEVHIHASHLVRPSWAGGVGWGSTPGGGE